jgi:hypothetical protein
MENKTQKQKLQMTLANKITLAQAGLSIVMFLLMVSENGWALLTASLIFAFAAATDWNKEQFIESQKFMELTKSRNNIYFITGPTGN